MATLSLHSIVKTFGKTEVIKDISFAVDDGEFVVFVGPSGCGKSTLLRIIAGLEDQTSGELRIDDQEVSNKEPIERGVAMVFQSYALYPHLSVFDNIAFPLRLKKNDKQDVKKRVKAVAATLDLTNRLHHKPSELSGGQRQRVAIGRAIVRDPKMFLFDEPLSNLDASLRGAMRVELSELHQKLQTTMIYVTHDQVEAMTMADRIVVLNDGVLEQFGTPMELYHKPQSRFVAGFIGQPGMNFIPATLTDVGAGQIAMQTAVETTQNARVDARGLNTGDTVEIGIRPDDFTLADNGTGYAVRVRVLERLGATTIAYGNLADNTPICASLDGLVKLQAGDQVTLTVDPDAVHVFEKSGRALSRLAAPEL
ncbi:ABC transporter ATP-binding protein [Pseudopelagicola sp. nBUS_19]|mgnify:CR=1 FL=1|uniref:ABC transporter ATP-binding protein n=1 Tax=Pseudopelagicola sp. nBUS_19 TaxID=3395316 RepID=UPI003EB69C84